MIAAAAAHSTRLHAYVLLAFSTGCRSGELLAADVTDLGEEWGQPALHVVRKGGHRQAIRLDSHIRTVVAAHTKGRRTGPLFVTRSGRRWDRTGVSRQLHHLADHALSEGDRARFRPNATRVAAIGLALADGADPLYVMASVGHRRLETTMRYAVHQRQLAANPQALLSLTEP
jgi:site-specific recombinase XerD